MFDIGWSELMLIGVVALVVIGPKELPSVLRTVGRTMGKLRRMANEFQGQFQDALREADLADMRKEISDMTETARSTVSSLEFDPLESVREEIHKTVEQVEKPLGATPEAASTTSEAGSSLGQAISEPEAKALVPLPPAEPLPEPYFESPDPEPAPVHSTDEVFEPKKSAS